MDTDTKKFQGRKNRPPIGDRFHLAWNSLSTQDFICVYLWLN